MPTYRKSKKLSSRKLGESSLEVRGEDNGRSGDRIPTSQWKEENTSRCQRLEHYDHNDEATENLHESPYKFEIGQKDGYKIECKKILETFD